MRLTIEQLRQAIRHACNPSLSHRAVACLVEISPNTVRGLRDRLSQRGEGWEQLRDLEDAALQARFSGGVRAVAVELYPVGRLSMSNCSSGTSRWICSGKSSAWASRIACPTRSSLASTGPGVTSRKSACSRSINPATSCLWIFADVPCPSSTATPEKCPRLKFVSVLWEPRATSTPRQWPAKQ